ncbi:class I SAM-dependent methyltransferase [Trueperella bialowiezensis]|uniref:23S rRNA (Uracil(747)-C(5))-methyltransferase RlmC n=1 Tax=Trueperella bialowiezensis TaxID=312285 RepID=A0A3S4VTC3_9ACTO|nr:methyltransferase domain-containing protein [Trueperella bialowiezensis]VEI13276.1 23S rRNA (uracil(747)-C(5))-methyltransferase RlmC [Trueperella bialowiezensis]
MLLHRDLHVGHEPLLDCHYYAAAECRSCTLITTPQDVQLARKQARAEELILAAQWLPPHASAREVFRNKVKLAVSGTPGSPRLGIIDHDGVGHDLRECPLPTPGIQEATPALAQFVAECGFSPYNPRTNTGELKFIIITESPDGELMVRFVAKRRGIQGMLFKKLARLRELVPAARVISLNVQPERKAIIEGPEEIVISDDDVLPMRLQVAGQELELLLRPQSFFQTNTDGAETLYTRAVEWLAETSTAWDLYCGVGGFALALAARGVDVVGVETQEQAVAAAQAAAERLRDVAGTQVNAQFIAADATEWARAQAGAQGRLPDAIVVNPPRRGIGAELAGWLNDAGPATVLYSSCNAASLAADLARMPAYGVVKAQVVDMFPHTRHFEVIALLER